MARWEPNARGRLTEAALELYAERGFEPTTVEDIASRAGLSKRTFFRHFADKREVLFAGGTEFEELVTGAVEQAPAADGPLAAVALGLQAAASMLEGRRAFARRRRQAIATSPDLQERELIKMASLAVALAAVLRRRGVAEPAAGLTGEIAVAVFRNAYERWADDPAGPDLPAVVRAALADLRTLTGPSPAPRRRAARAVR